MTRSGGRPPQAETCGRDLHGSSALRPSRDSRIEARRHDVIRTGGPAVTEDVLAELIVSTRVLGSREIMLLNHTGCGFTTFTDAELNAKFSKLTGDATPAPMRFFAFKDPEQQTKDQIKMVRSHPWISKEVPVRGFIFDVNTGRLREVMALGEAAS